MTRRPLPPVGPEDLPEDLKALLAAAGEQMGFTPSDVLMMANWPDLLRAMGSLVFTVWRPGEVGMELKRLVGLLVSHAAGCQYCVAHNVHGLALDGVDEARIAAVWEFEQSPLFSAAERAALRVAVGAGQSPNAVTDQDLAALREHYTPRQIAEIGAVIGLFGFLNRWNATLRSPLEAEPAAVAHRLLASRGWSPGVHDAVD
jgi:uncharacterized peroxidase-related enzyme